MSWYEVAKAVYDRAIADTGSGGLFNATGDQKINAWFSNEATLNQSLPYAVASNVSTIYSDVFPTANQTIEVNFDVTVYHDKKVSSSDAKHEAACARIVTLFRRWQPTISGYTVSQVLLDGKPVEAQPSGEVLQTVLSFRVYLST